MSDPDEHSNGFTPPPEPLEPPPARLDLIPTRESVPHRPPLSISVWAVRRSRRAERDA
jgi:hypothetical protein